MENLADTTITKWSKLTAPILGKSDITCHLIWCSCVPKYTVHISVISRQKYITLILSWRNIRQIQTEEYSTKKWHDFLKNVKVIKDRKRLRNQSTSKKTKKWLQLNAILAQGKKLFFFCYKTLVAKFEKTLWLQYSIFNVHFLILIIVLWLCKKMSLVFRK